MSDAIVIAVLIFVFITIMRNRGQGQGPQRLREFFGDRQTPPPPAALPETNREQVARLEERVRVLERIVTDRNHDLANEIEALRIETSRDNKEPTQ